MDLGSFSTWNSRRNDELVKLCVCGEGKQVGRVGWEGGEFGGSVERSGVGRVGGWSVSLMGVGVDWEEWGRPAPARSSNKMVTVVLCGKHLIWGNGSFDLCGPLPSRWSQLFAVLLLFWALAHIVGYGIAAFFKWRVVWGPMAALPMGPCARCAARSPSRCSLGGEVGRGFALRRLRCEDLRDSTR